MWYFRVYRSFILAGVTKLFLGTGKFQKGPSFLSFQHHVVNLDYWLTMHRIITLVDLQLDAQNSYLFTGDCLVPAQDSHLQRVTIPEAAYIQLRRRPPEDEQGNCSKHVEDFNKCIIRK